MLFRIHYYGALFTFVCGMGFGALHAAHDTPQAYLDSLKEESGACGGAGVGPVAGRKRKIVQVGDSRETVMWYPVIVSFMRESNESGVGLGKEQLHACAQNFARIVFDVADAMDFDHELAVAGFKRNLLYVQELIGLPSSRIPQRTLSSLICLNNHLCFFYAQLTQEDFNALFHPLSTCGRARHELFVAIVESIRSFITSTFYDSYHALDMELAPLKYPHGEGLSSYAAVAAAAGAASLSVKLSEESARIFTTTAGELPASWSLSEHTYPLIPGELPDAESHPKLGAAHDYAIAVPASPAGRFNHAGAFGSPSLTVVAFPYDDALGSPASSNAQSTSSAGDLYALARISPVSPLCCVAVAAVVAGDSGVVIAGDSDGMRTPTGRVPAVPQQRAPARLTPRTRAAQRAEQADTRRASLSLLDESDLAYLDVASVAADGGKRVDEMRTPTGQAPAVSLGWAPRKATPSPFMPLTLSVVAPPDLLPSEEGRLSVVREPAPAFRRLQFKGAQGSVETVGGTAADGAQRAPSRGVARRVALPPEADDALSESDDAGTTSDEDSD